MQTLTPEDIKLSKLKVNLRSGNNAIENIMGENSISDNDLFRMFCETDEFKLFYIDLLEFSISMRFIKPTQGDSKFIPCRDSDGNIDLQNSLLQLFELFSLQFPKTESNSVISLTKSLAEKLNISPVNLENSIFKFYRNSITGFVVKYMVDEFLESYDKNTKIVIKTGRMAPSVENQIIKM